MKVPSVFANDLPRLPLSPALKTRYQESILSGSIHSINKPLSERSGAVSSQTPWVRVSADVAGVLIFEQVPKMILMNGQKT